MLNNKEEEKIRIRPESVDETELYNEISKLYDITKKLRKNKKEEDKLKRNLKEISLNEYLEEFKSNNENPSTIIIEAYNNNMKAEFMYTVADKYIKIKNEEEADELIEKYGKDVIIKDRKYLFNPEMLDKYSEIISNMIMESSEIDETDKGNLFVAEETYKVKEGSINKLMDIRESAFKEVNEIFEDLKPIQSILSAKIIKS